jgi:Protein of unknown function (DUF3606)
MERAISRRILLPDDSTKKAPQDATRVNIHEDYEIEYWSKKFGVTPSQLRAAVAKVGTLARQVETELKRR